LYPIERRNEELWRASYAERSAHLRYSPLCKIGYLSTLEVGISDLKQVECPYCESDQPTAIYRVLRLLA